MVSAGENTPCRAASLRARVWRAIAAIDGADQGSSIFADDDAEPALWVDGTQVAHFHANDVLEVRLTKERIRADRERLRGDARVTLRKNASDWLKVTFARQADIAFVRDLVETAVAAHRPPKGVRSRPPPGGAELARRKRFH